MALTDRKCKTAVCTQKITRMADGNGLSLVLHPNGSKYWQGRYRVDGKERTKSLGQYPSVSLAEARKEWAEFRETLHPDAPAKATFAEMYHRLCEWKRQKGIVSLRNFISSYAKLPDWFVNTNVDDIQRYTIDTIVQKEVARGRKTAHLVLYSLISQVLDFAVDTGYVEHNVAARMGRILPTYATEHRPSMDKTQVGMYIHHINTLRVTYRSMGNILAPIFLKLSLLTATRRMELVKVHIDELDLENAMWVIPAHRMKMRRDHMVPLSSQAVVLFKQLIVLSNGNGELIYSHRGGKYITENIISPIHHRLAQNGVHHCLHGNRALFATVAQEELGFSYDIADAQLAHFKKDMTERAYNRATFIEQRIDLMQQWADWIDTQARAYEGSVGGILYPLDLL